MYSNYFQSRNVNQYQFNPYYASNPNAQQPYYDYYRAYPAYPNYFEYRQQPIKGQATWTEGGQVTKCGIPWSDNEYMTAAVGEDSPYQCGQTLKIRNPQTQREILAEVVDKVQGFPANKINLHRRAFLALGANPNVGVINVEITPSPDVEQEEWGKYLIGVTQSAYPGYNVTNYKYVGKTQISPTQTKQAYEFILKSPQEEIKVQGNVIYNPNTNRVISFDIKEM